MMLVMLGMFGMFTPGHAVGMTAYAAGAASSASASSQKPVITTQPKNKTVETGKTASFSVKASGSGLKYQWFYKKSGAKSWTKWKNKTKSSVSLKAAKAWNGAQFYCKVTDNKKNTVKSKTAKLNVTEKASAFSESDAKWLHSEAQRILKKITTKDMNKMQKGYAIYRWTKRNISYAGSSDKSDYRIGARDGLLNRRGDCFTYFAVAKVLLDEAGIKNKSVVKLRKSEKEARHYWSLINVGTGWYHFDCTQYHYPKANFYMVTDKELKKWDKTYYAGAHRYSAKGMPKMATKSVQGMIDYSAATLSLAKELTITSQPKSKTVKTGNTASFSVKASGDKVTYQWYYKKKGADAWTKWKDKTKASVSVKAVKAWNGAQFYCRVTDSHKNTEKSKTAKLTVKQS